jgi:ABC-type antimicrobial peptide transport system permease subunit
MDGYVEIRGVNETTCPEPIAGGMPTQPYTLMIPSVFFPDSSAETATSFPDALDGISLLGTTVLIPISETETKAYTIVGVYDAQLTLDDPHICYASFESIADMQETEPDPTNTTVVVFADDWRHTDILQNQLLSLGYTVRSAGQVAEELPLMVSIIGSVLTIVFLAVIGNYAILSTLQDLHRRKSEFSIYRAIGYHFSAIAFPLLAEQVFLGIAQCATAIGIYALLLAALRPLLEILGRPWSLLRLIFAPSVIPVCICSAFLIPAVCGLLSILRLRKTMLKE